MARKKPNGALAAVLLAASPLLLAACCAVGSAGIPLGQVAREVFLRLSGRAPEHAQAALILFGIRMPRALLAYLVGAALAVSGVCMQGVFQNPMADPHLLGVSGGAALGAAGALVLGLTGFAQAALAFAGGVMAVALVRVLAGRGFRQPTRLLLSGVALSALLSAALSGMLVLCRSQSERILHWTMGSFSTASGDKLLVTACLTLPLSAALCLFARPLNALGLGDEQARSLGVNAARTRALVVLLATFNTAAAISACGIVGFVGLMVPHGVRFVTGSDHRAVLPAALPAGGLFLMLMDTLSRTVAAPLELPVGILTSVLGGAFFFVLMRRAEARS